MMIKKRAQLVNLSCSPHGEKEKKANNKATKGKPRRAQPSGPSSSLIHPCSSDRHEGLLRDSAAAGSSGGLLGRRTMTPRRNGLKVRLPSSLSQE
ncbi:hypothetical protein ACLB2K_013156 [Fragaria x ananassa]